MHALLTTCFGVKLYLLLAETTLYSEKMRKSLLATEITKNFISPIAVSLIERCIQSLNQNTGFGVWPKQAGVSVHREFRWNERKIDLVEDRSYPERLKEAVS